MQLHNQFSKVKGHMLVLNSLRAFVSVLIMLVCCCCSLPLSHSLQVHGQAKISFGSLNQHKFSPEKGAILIALVVSSASFATPEPSDGFSGTRLANVNAVLISYVGECVC